MPKSETGYCQNWTKSSAEITLPTLRRLSEAFDNRRYFIAGLAEDEATAKAAIAAINRLYTIEHDADIAGLSIEERKEKRQKEAYPVIKDLETWLYTKVGIYPEKSPKDKAVNYALTHMPKMARYVNDGRFRPDNNDIEEVIRPTSIRENGWSITRPRRNTWPPS